MAQGLGQITHLGRIKIDGKVYQISTEPGAYSREEVPSKPDIDPKMERRVIYVNPTMGIQKRREEKSSDAAMGMNAIYSPHGRSSEGIWWANGCDTRSQDRIFAQRAVTASNYSTLAGLSPVQIGDANVYSWMITQGAVYVLSAGNGTWLLSATVGGGNNILDAIQYNGKLYVAIGSTNNYWTWDQTTTTTVWAQAVGAGLGASHFVVIRNQLWRSVNANIYATVDGSTWGGATVVGDPNTNITELDVFQDFLIIFKQDGVYSADKTGNVYPIFPGFKNLGMNPRPLGEWKGKYYFASDVGMIWSYSVRGEVESIGFDNAEPYPMGGSPTPTLSIPNPATTGIALPNYFIVGFLQYSGATPDAYYLAWDGKGWHPFRHYVGRTPTAIGVTGGNQNPVNPVIQFGYKDNAGNTYVDFMTNPLIDPFLATSFDTTAQTLYFPIDNGALEDEWKVLERIVVAVDNASSGTIGMAIAVDDDISSLTYKDLGSPQGTGEIFQTFLPNSPLPLYKKVSLRLTITPKASTSTPIVRYVICHYKQRTPYRRLWNIQIIGDIGAPGAGGPSSFKSTKAIVALLEAARTNNNAVDYQDLTSDSFQVYVEDIAVKSKE